MQIIKIVIAVDVVVVTLCLNLQQGNIERA